MVDSGRFVNDSMGGYVGKQTVKKIIAAGKGPKGAKVLVMGITFKENVTDIRNSKVIDVVKELADYGCVTDIVDPFANKAEVKKEYGLELLDKPRGKYDAVIIAVNHAPYLELDEKYFSSLLDKNGIVVDVKGIYRSKIKSLTYWSL